MIIQEQLYKKIENLINSKKNNKAYEDIEFRLSKSNTTKSIYITIITYAGEEKIRMKYRISDHRNSEVKTKLIRKSTNFGFIERKVESLIKKARSMRYYKTLNGICHEKHI